MDVESFANISWLFDIIDSVDEDAVININESDTSAITHEQ